MKLTRVIASGVILASLGLGVVNAQSFSPMDSPAEFPPASYKGKQYVDSRGCVYIRAGVDGAVTWVPRVTRNREVICGFKPTFAEPVAGTAAAPKLGKDVVQIQPATEPTEEPGLFGLPKRSATNGNSAAATATAAPRTTTKKTTAKPATTAATTTTTRPKTTSAARSTTTASRPATASTTTTTARKPAATTSTTTATTRTNARRTTTQAPRNAGTLSLCRDGVNTYKGMKVRCGPQADAPYTPGSGTPTAQPPVIPYNDQSSSLNRPAPGTIVRAGEVAANVRVMPRHVYEANVVSQSSDSVPDGYRIAFDDGRLNRRRAEMTLAGKAQMDQVWTETLPRRLIPKAVDGTGVVARAVVATEPASTAPVVSTRSQSPEPSLRLAGTPYVQVGTYSDAATAQAAAQKVRRMGLPVRIGKYERDGATQRMVLAGPFADADAAQAALGKAQKAGYPEAFVRR